jgi:hypothetical protein
MKRLTQAFGSFLIASLLLHSPAMAQDRLLLPGQSKQISDLQAQNKLLEQRINQIQQQMAVLLQIIKISGADVEINAGNNLTFKAGRDMQINPAISLFVNTSTLNIHSNSSSIESTGPSYIKAGATMSIRAAVLGLNNASKPIATVGSIVTVGGNAGQIISGSATILAE